MKKELTLKAFPNGFPKNQTQSDRDQFDQINQQVDEALRVDYQNIQVKGSRILELNNQLQDDDILKKLISAIEKDKYQEKHLDHFLTVLVEAFQAELAHESHTPQHTVEQIMLSIGWLNGTDKKDFLSIYEKIPVNCFTEQGSRNIFSLNKDDKDKRLKWLRSYLETDYNNSVNELIKFSIEDRAEYFLTHPEKLAFLYYGRPLLDASALPTMGFKQIKFNHPVTNEIVRMPDCMEYAILNKMLNDLAGGQGN